MNSTSSQLPLMLEKLCQGVSLSQEESFEQFNLFMRDQLSAIEMSALLTALKAKGETAQEIVGALQVLRNVAIPFPHRAQLNAQYDIVDCVGTGGDGQHTLNISTSVAFVLAALGIKVAKHGNRAVSSKCGSADLFEKLGVNLEAPSHIAQRALIDVGLCFLFAPFYNPAIQRIRQLRSSLKIKTLFNLLGPLLNPIQPNIMLIGVYDSKYCKLIAEVLQSTGVKSALVVHGEGLDEIAIHGTTTGYLLKNNIISPFSLTPLEAGIAPFPLSSLTGQDPAYNAKACLDLLQGKGQSAYRASVAINCAAVLFLLDKVATIKDGVSMAQAIMDGDEAYKKLLALKEVSHAK